MANGPLSLSHLGQLDNQEAGTMGNNHTPGLPGAGTLPGRLTGGGRSNRNVPYLQQNCLPHNCTATSDTSTPTSNNTSHRSNSTSNAEEAWKSQQHSTQVHNDGTVTVELLLSVLSVYLLRSSSLSL